jgi:predicted nucleic acid-binding protein
VVLVDTSVWIEHLRHGNRHLAGLLEAGDVACHPLVIGELACGSLRERQSILDLLSALPQADHAADNRIPSFIETHRLHGQGIGLIDVYLVYGAIAGSHRLWTLDRNLRRVAARLAVAWT